MMEATGQDQSMGQRYGFEAVAFGTFGLLLFFMVGGMESGIYVAGLLGAIASAALGWHSVRQGWVSLPEGIKRFGTRWLYVVGFAALSLMNGKWEPIVFAAVVAITMTGLYALGARSAQRTRGGQG